LVEEWINFYNTTRIKNRDLRWSLFWGLFYSVSRLGVTSKLAFSFGEYRNLFAGFLIVDNNFFKRSQ
jgi:hypothetical protein